MKNIGARAKQATKKLLSALPERARDVLEKRFGLSDEAEHPLTLDAIGKTYGITRERVRQIENHAIAALQKSPLYTEHEPLFVELHTELTGHGGLLAEQDLLRELNADEHGRRHLTLLLSVGTPFYRGKENPVFHERWYTEKKVAQAVEDALADLHDTLTEDTLMSAEEMVAALLSRLSGLPEECRTPACARRWLTLSKMLGQNPLGEWGLAKSPNVEAKGVRDFAYLAVKRHGSPLHYREVAEAIERLFTRKAHTATCHNELIKDKRFVLVGRGMYALAEWGYNAGAVKDVLRDILEKEGPLAQSELITRVRTERYVKDNTIAVNLQDRAFFKRLADGRFALADIA